MSTLSGVLLGITAAAAVTVFYGDALNRKLEDLMRGTQVTAHAVEATLQSIDVSLPSPAEVAPAQQVVVAEHRAPEPTDAALARKWQEFASQSEHLQAVGHFEWRECFKRASAAYGISEALLLAVGTSAPFSGSCAAPRRPLW